MKKIITFLTISCFAIFLGNAQRGFNNKKRSGTTKQKVEKPNFKYPKSRLTNVTPLIGQKKQSFQMKGFNPTLVKGYIHDAIKKDETGHTYFIKSHPTKETTKKTSKLSTTAVYKSYLEEVAPLLGVTNPENEFKLFEEHQDAQGNRHVKMQQYYNGVKVYGSELIIHISKGNTIKGMNGRTSPTPSVANVSPSLSKNNAFDLAYKSLGIDRTLNHESSKEQNSGQSLKIILKDYEKAELVLLENGDIHTLAWHLTVYEDFINRWEYFIDAANGSVVDKYYGTCTLHYHGFEETEKNNHIDSNLKPLPPTTASARDLNGVNRQLNTFLQDGTYYMIDTSKPMFDSANSSIPQEAIGAVQTLDLRNEPPEEGTSIFFVASTNNTWADQSAVSAHYNAEVAYEYFSNTFNRNSINGQGGTISSIVNVADPNTGGGFDNAFWNGQFMAYGNGNTAFTPLAGALDVGGHEMSHGVIQNTANLVYQDQAGAINESFADVFGVMIDREDWLLGEDIVTNAFPSGALRDMQNPNNGGSQLGDRGWQPKDMTEFYTGTQDNGGVHINSGIPNRACYLIATEIGRDKTEQIYYKALTDYLTANSQFVDLRIAVLQSAADLYGDNSAEVQAAANAFDTVGITDGAASDTDEDLPPAVGDNFILSYDVNDADANTLYILDTDGSNFIPVSQTSISRKPSISDDGSFAIFVTEDNTINGVELNRSSPSETVISEEEIWSSIALSKDGTKLAVSFNDETNRIFIIDLVSGTNQEFTLFNPTSQDGVTTGEVLYPDALEWDYTGEHLIYDALNGLTNPSGLDIEYWDVGRIKVWDNATNDFGDGSIQKLFTNLPEGVSIGNPSISKTSNNIIAFDFYDSIDDEYAVLTANIETNDLVEVWRHDKLGFPNYSSTDDRLLFDAFTDSDDEVIAVIGLGADKLTPSGNASILIPDAIWGIWYTEGGRDTSTSSENDITDFRFINLEPPVVATINGTTISAVVPSNTNVSNLIATFTNSNGATVKVNGVEQQSGVTANDFLNTVIYTVTAANDSAKDYSVNVTVENANDDDNDGVSNDLDQCPNTPIGIQVDVTGCEIFSLPSINFSVSSTGESCINSENGSISISAAQNMPYTASLFGGQVNTFLNFTSNTVFENLSGGSYQLCITVAGQTDYESCFNIVIDEPEALSVSSKIDRAGKTVSLTFAGAERYIITLNETVFTTTENELVLDLPDGMSQLSVKTDKDCQGIFNDEIVLVKAPTLYPNPLVAEQFSVSFSEQLLKPVQIQIFAMDGRQISSNYYPMNRNQVTVSSADLSAGLYLVKVISEKDITNF